MNLWIREHLDGLVILKVLFWCRLATPKSNVSIIDHPTLENYAECNHGKGTVFSPN